MKKVRWGILSTAQIGVKKVIPAMRQGKYSQVTAIASRDLKRAQAAAKTLHLPKAYGSYEELLADPEIDAVYNPLPNHLHVPWTLQAMQAGKHVLCEKPIAMSAAEAQSLAEEAARRPHLKVMEAFMYRVHPQWLLAYRLARGGEIGQLKTVQSFFAYHNLDPHNIRNIPDYGGGGLMDIGCYCISLSRLLFNAEPRRVFGILDMDPAFQVDRLASGILDFGEGVSTFTCGTQLAFYQRVNILGDRGRVEIEIPFNPPSDRPCKVWVRMEGEPPAEVQVEACDHYTIQGDLFSRAVINDTPPPISLQDSIGNMRVIESIIKSSQTGRWVRL